MSFPISGTGYQVGDGNTAEPLFGVQSEPIQLPNGNVTLTAAQLTSGLLVAVAGTTARGYTLPTAALLNALLVQSKTGATFDAVIVNLGTSTGIVTLTGGTGVTIVGVNTVAATTSAQFRARKSADGSWVLYRI